LRHYSYRAKRVAILRSAWAGRLARAASLPMLRRRLGWCQVVHCIWQLKSTDCHLLELTRRKSCTRKCKFPLHGFIEAHLLVAKSSKIESVKIDLYRWAWASAGRGSNFHLFFRRVSLFSAFGGSAIATLNIFCRAKNGHRMDAPPC